MLSKEEERSKIKEQLEEVEYYLLDKRNIDVIYGHDLPNAFCGEYISINSRQNLRYQLHTLLHEAGHALIRSRKDKFEKEYPGLKKRNNSVERKLDTLKEEFQAWDRGKKLADRLGLDLDEAWWRRHKKNCLYDYVRWASNVGG